MRKKLLSGISLFLAGIISLICTCKEIPTNPFEDGKNLQITMFLSGGLPTVNAGDSMSVGLVVNIPNLVKKLTVVQGDDQKELTVVFNQPESLQPDTVYFRTMYKLSGKKEIIVNASLGDGIIKPFPFSIFVVTAESKVFLDTIPKDTTVFTGQVYNFNVAAHAVPSSAIAYTVISTPSLDSNSLSIHGNNSGVGVFKSTVSGTYTIKIFASNGAVKDSGLFKVTVIPVPSVQTSAKVNNPGVVDTISVTGVAGDSLSLDNGSSFKTGEIVVLNNASKNVLVLQFTPLEPKMYEVKIRVKGISGDGIYTIPLSVGGSSVSLWKQDTLTLAVCEDTTISYSLVSLLKDPSATNVVFSSPDTGVSGTDWKYTIPWGAALKDTISLFASNGGSELSELKVFLVVSSKDTAGPQITLVNPSTGDATVSDSVFVCKFTVADILSGVGTILVKNGTTALTDTVRSGSTFQCTVSGLKKGEKTTLTIEAYDKSIRKNSSTMQVQLTYDPTMQDNVQPELRHKLPATGTATVATTQTSIEIIAVDRNAGIDSVWAFRGTTRLPVVQKDSVYSVALDNLIAGKTDTIIFKAQDKSALKNAGSLQVYITCEPTANDKNGPVILLKNPSANNSTVADASVLVRVVCLDSSKVKSVSYKLGTLAGAMTKESDSVFSATIAGLVTGKNLITISAKDASANSNATDSVFTVIYDPAMNDTVKPVITCPKATRDTILVNSASTTIEVNCTDSSGIGTVTCTNGTVTLPVTAGSGSLYSATVSALTAGANTFVFTATDKATKPNSVTKTIVVMYDPTATDVTGPVIKLSSPAQDRSKVAQASATLVVVCKDTNGIGAVNYTFGTLGGAMHKDNDSTFSVALANLAKGDNQITVVATDASSKKNASDTVFTIIYDPTMNDVDDPVITLKSPEKDSTKVSSKSIAVSVVCTDSSGIDTVICKIGSIDIAVVKGTGGVYTASMITQTAGTFTFTFTATDKASTKHSSTKAVTVICDPTMTDNVKPTVTIKNPQNADQRVFTDTITVQIDCTDDSKIASVTATRGGEAVTGITNVGSLYSLKVTGLIAGKSDTIKFKVVDSSSNKNQQDFPVILRYNRNPIAAKLATPADGATNVAKSPTFTWSEGTDPDGDVVTYTLRYGTSETALTKIIPDLTGKTATPATALNAATKYYWQVVAYTKVNGDSAVSAIGSFTTIEDAPVIKGEPSTQSVVLGSKGTFSVTATGSNLKYQWYKGTTAISGATLPTYTTGAVIASDDGSTYYCAVSNDGGVVKTNVVSIIVLYSVTYDVNGGSGTIPVDDKTYAKGKSATVKSGSGLTKTNFTFGGWVRHGVNNSTVYKADDSLMISSGNVTLDAVWNAVTYTLTYDGNGSTGGSAPSSVTGIVMDATVTVSNAGSLVKTNSEFLGWSTDPNASIPNYTAASKIQIKSNTTLYAIWNALPTFSINYLANGGGKVSGHGTGDVPTDPKVYTAGTTVNVLGNDGTLTREGYVWGGWSTTKNGKAVTSVKMESGNMLLYARWLIRDASGNEYTELEIGGKVWMAQNLKTIKLNSGEILPTVTPKTASYVVSKYGILYNGYAVMKDTNSMFAPPGWHVATSDDWYAVKDMIMDAKGIASKDGWTASSDVGTVGYLASTNNDSWGFTAYPDGGGSCDEGTIDGVGESASFWRSGFSMEWSGDYVWYLGQIWNIRYDSPDLTYGFKNDACHFASVRCVRNY